MKRNFLKMTELNCGFGESGRCARAFRRDGRNRASFWVLAMFAVFLALVGTASSAEGNDPHAMLEATLARMFAPTFYHPWGVAIDRAGNVYAALSSGNQIVKISPAGVMKVWAGQPGVPGYTDGVGTSAKFVTPENIATDKAGNVYVTDRTAYTIRKITPARVVTTVAGTAFDQGDHEGVGPQAGFFDCRGITTDGAGNLYVVNDGGLTIRKITPGRVVTTLAGTRAVRGHADGTGSAASFDDAHGIASDRSGNLYVADTKNGTIRKITPKGAVTTFAGTAGIHGHADGTGAAARFFDPYDLAADRAGNLYVIDGGPIDTIRKITPAGMVTTLTVSPGVSNGHGPEPKFASLVAIAIDGAGNIYVADAGNESIRKITPDGRVTTLAHLPDLNNRPKAEAD